MCLWFHPPPCPRRIVPCLRHGPGSAVQSIWHAGAARHIHADGRRPAHELRGGPHQVLEDGEHVHRAEAAGGRADRELWKPSGGWRGLGSLYLPSEGGGVGRPPGYPIWPWPGEIGKFGRIEISDIAGYAELPDRKVLSGSESGSLLLWENNLIKVEVHRGEGQRCHDGAIEVVHLTDDCSAFITAGHDGYALGRMRRLAWWVA